MTQSTTKPESASRPCIDASWTVNDVIRTYPESVGVFNASGVDSCCGGHETLESAAREATININALISALRIATHTVDGKQA